MTNLMLNEEQMRQVAAADGEIALRDGNGRLVGYLDRGFSADEIEQAERDLDSEMPRYTTPQVLDHLRGEERAEIKRRLASDEPRHTTADVLAHLRSIDSHQP